MPTQGHFLLKLLLFTLFTTLSLQHQCNHDNLPADFKVAGPSYAIYDKHDGRFLAQYQSISILVDASTLTGVTDDFWNYIVNSIMPAVTNYFEATIQVPPRTKNLKAGGYSSLCSGDIKIPSIYNTNGVAADLVLFVRAVNDSTATYVAAASACLLDTTTYRPIIGRMTYNLAKVSASASDADREQDIVTTMHELTHVLGFSSSLFPYYVNPATGLNLVGHVLSQSINGLTYTVLNTTALTTRLQNHFNCSTLPGALMENQGGSGSAGSHFERRVFYNEYMTASSLIDARVSEFTLALLEGTGWYQINYNMAEPMTWGQNEGCNFVMGACMNTATKKPNFKEFCPSLVSKGCSWTYRAGSSCGAFQLQTSSSLSSAINWWKNNTVAGDSFGDNCPMQLTYGNLDCEDTDNQAGATIAGETYAYGSKCFLGTLYPRGKLASPYPYCFKSTCKLDNQGNNYIQLTIGTKTVNCTSAKDISVSGYNGVLSCPDPDAFCGQVLAEGYCRRGCSGRGACLNQQCACIEGWSGFDCSKPTYLDQCARCADNDPLQTSCYGDSCSCNPSNTTCMCLTGFQNGANCAAILAAFSATTNTGLSSDTSDSSSTLSPSTTAEAISISNSNATIDERASVSTPSSDQTTMEQVQATTSSTSVLLPALLGAIGGALAMIGIYFGAMYFKKRRTKGRTISRPPKLTIPVRPLEEVSNHSNPSHQNSPANISRGRLSFRSNNDSPLISNQSPMKERIYTHSLFKNYSPDRSEKNSAESKEATDFGLKLEPVIKEDSRDIEDPHEVEKQEVEKDEAKNTSPKFGLVAPEEVEIVAQDVQTESVQK